MNVEKKDKPDDRFGRSIWWLRRIIALPLGILLVVTGVFGVVAAVALVMLFLLGGAALLLGLVVGVVIAFAVPVLLWLLATGIGPYKVKYDDD